MSTSTKSKAVARKAEMRSSRKAFTGRLRIRRRLSGGSRQDAPKFTDEEMKIIGTPLDFVGINVDISLLLVVAADQPSFNLPASVILKTCRRRSGSVASIP